MLHKAKLVCALISGRELVVNCSVTLHLEAGSHSKGTRKSPRFTDSFISTSPPSIPSGGRPCISGSLLFAPSFPTLLGRRKGPHSNLLLSDRELFLATVLPCRGLIIGCLATLRSPRSHAVEYSLTVSTRVVQRIRKSMNTSASPLFV